MLLLNSQHFSQYCFSVLGQSFELRNLFPAMSDTDCFNDDPSEIVKKKIPRNSKFTRLGVGLGREGADGFLMKFIYMSVC